MIQILCKNCGLLFGNYKMYKLISTLEAENLGSFTQVLHCPFCSRQWKQSKISGIKWRVYPHLKKVIEKYLRIK